VGDLIKLFLLFGLHLFYNFFLLSLVLKIRIQITNKDKYNIRYKCIYCKSSIQERQ